MMYQKQSLENYSITIYSLKGISSSPPWLLLCDNPQTRAALFSLSAGAVWGDRHCPFLHCTRTLNFKWMAMDSREPKKSSSLSSFQFQVQFFWKMSS